jgi:fused signal recognition particle receptor
MFNFFKEKIKSWIGKSKEKLEETAQKVEEKPEVEEIIKPEKDTKKKEAKADKANKKEEKKPEKTKKEKGKKEVKEAEEEIKEEKSSFKKIKGWFKGKKAGEEAKAELKEETKEELEEIEKEAEEEEKKEEEAIKEIEKEEDKKEKEEKELEGTGVIEQQEEEKDIEERLEDAEEKLKEQKKELAKEKKQEDKKGKKEEEESKEEIKEKEEKPKSTIFSRLKERFSYKLSEEDFESIFEDLEMMLLENNVALEATEAIKKQLKTGLVGKEIKKDQLEEKIKEALKEAIENILIEPDDILSLVKEKQPFVMVFFGINGTGKTTTIAKVASLLLKNKISCVLAAADTFRAASIEQIQIHADKLGLKVIKHDYGADPAAVAFDAIKHAKAHNIQVVLIDTAGRMHTSDNLLSEMEKICRVTDPDLKIFVAESISGNDATNQARNFDESIGIDGSILTKSDVDEKGGTAISISYITKKPILFLGVGQNYGDLEIFDKKKFIEKLGL